MREDRIEGYAIINRYGIHGHQRLMAMRLFDHMRSATRRMKGLLLYKYIMITIRERQYLVIDSKVVDEFINCLVPHFASMHGRWKKAIQ